jgi:N-acetylneuraminic acid mutarotase
MRSLYLVVGLVTFVSQIATAQSTPLIDMDWHDRSSWGNASPGAKGIDYHGTATDATTETNVFVNTSSSKMGSVRDQAVSAVLEASVTINGTSGHNITASSTTINTGIGFSLAGARNTWSLTEDANDPVARVTASTFTRPNLEKTKTYFASGPVTKILKN